MISTSRPFFLNASHYRDQPSYARLLYPRTGSVNKSSFSFAPACPDDSSEPFTFRFSGGDGRKLKASRITRGPIVTAPVSRSRFPEPGLPAEVPPGALVHILWQNGRNTDAHLVDHPRVGMPNAAKCEFPVRREDFVLIPKYRACNPGLTLELHQNILWRRGLGGPWGYFRGPPLILLKGFVKRKRSRMLDGNG